MKRKTSKLADKNCPVGTRFLHAAAAGGPGGAVKTMKGTGFASHCLSAIFICIGASALRGEPARSPQADSPRTPDHLAGASIPSGTNAVLSAGFTGRVGTWLTHLMVDAYNKNGHPNPRVAEFLKEAILEMCDPTQVGKAGSVVAGEAESFNAQGEDDPIFYLAAGIVQKDKLRESQYMYKAMEGFSERPSSDFLKFIASAHLGMGLHELPAEELRQVGMDVESLEFRDAASLVFLRGALQECPFDKDDETVLMWWIVSYPVEDLFSRHASDAAGIIEKSDKIPEWILEYCRGVRAFNAAWQARGPGQNPTAGEMKGFTENLASAREHLVKSWKLKPEEPDAATRMIGVAAAEGEKIDTMRKWFDRAAAAQMDYTPAYINILLGLLPRWLGSHEEMIRFGEECMSTGRYDTEVPYQYVRALKDVSMDSGDGGAIFADPKINQNLQSVISAYLARDVSPVDKNYLHALAALFACKAGKLDVAKKHMEAINYQVSKWTVEFQKYGDVAAMLAAIRDSKP